MRHRSALAAAVLLLTVLPAAAAGTVTGSVRIRVEDWTWFETPGADDDYTFLGAQIRLAAARKFGRIEGTLELEAPALVNLPERAALPAPRGQLGLGGTYYAANGESDDAGLFVKQAFIRAGRFRIGRFEFGEGNEHAPADAQLAAIRRERLGHRLIGTFAFSHVGRSFDGLQFDAKPWTLLVARPTAGAFRVHGGRSLDVGLFYGSWVRSSARSDGRLFLVGYRDDRDVVKTDNRSAAARNADGDAVEIATVGGHYIARRGNAHLLIWGAAQRGGWGSLDHSAFAFDLEGGAQFKTAGVRGGWFHSSGDGDPSDGDHGTFFQVLPTPRIYARFPFYNAMNSDDMFLQATARPRAKVTISSEIHRLRLSNERDLWYAGGGAFDENVFGYTGRPSGGNGGLATVIDLSVDWRFTSVSTLTFYVGRAFGGDVVTSLFDGDAAVFAYVELLRRF